MKPVKGHPDVHESCLTQPHAEGIAPWCLYCTYGLDDCRCDPAVEGEWREFGRQGHHGD